MRSFRWYSRSSGDGATVGLGYSLARTACRRTALSDDELVCALIEYAVEHVRAAFDRSVVAELLSGALVEHDELFIGFYVDVAVHGSAIPDVGHRPQNYPAGGG